MKKTKLTSDNLYKKIKDKKKIILHNFYLDKIKKILLKYFVKIRKKKKFF